MSLGKRVQGMLRVVLRGHLSLDAVFGESLKFVVGRLTVIKSVGD